MKTTIKMSPLELEETLIEACVSSVDSFMVNPETISSQIITIVNDIVEKSIKK